MLYKEIVTSIYSEFLGKAIKNQLTTAHIFQNQIGYDEFDGTVVLLSETSAGEILKGKRNMSYNAMLAFQATLNYQTPKKLFLQDDFFKIQLLSRLTTLILNDSSFYNTLLRQTLNQKISNHYKGDTQYFIQSHKKLLINSLSNFFPDFTEELSSLCCKMKCNRAKKNYLFYF